MKYPQQSNLIEHHRLVMDVVCTYFGLKDSDIYRRDKTDKYVRPRHIIMFCLYYARGKWFDDPEGGYINEYGADPVSLLMQRDHSSVLHGHRTVVNIIDLAVITGNYKEYNMVKRICAILCGRGFELPLEKFNTIHERFVENKQQANVDKLIMEG